MSDGYAALIGASGGAPAGLIIAGTGVAGHRLFADGSSIERDGWGWVGGDRGSGAWVGQRALRHALAVADGLEPRDGLAEAVFAALRAISPAPRGWVPLLGPERLGAMAPLVLRAAQRASRRRSPSATVRRRIWRRWPARWRSPATSRCSWPAGWRGGCGRWWRNVSAAPSPCPPRMRAKAAGWWRSAPPRPSGCATRRGRNPLPARRAEG